MTERKLPKPSEYPDEIMTDKDWDFYFECRKKLDKPVSRDEINNYIDAANKLDSTYMESPDMDEFFRIAQLVPLTPSAALAIKHCQGFKALQEFNLYDAKKAYPEEF